MEYNVAVSTQGLLWSMVQLCPYRDYCGVWCSSVHTGTIVEYGVAVSTQGLL